MAMFEFSVDTVIKPVETTFFTDMAYCFNVM